MTVYSNEFSGEEVEFRIWDASECLLYGEVLEAFTFEADGLEGSPQAPVVLHTNSQVLRQIELRPGWNWVSFNLAFPDNSVAAALASVNDPSGDLVKSQTQFTQNTAGLGWLGSLTALGNTSMYQYRTADADTIDHVGALIDPTTVNIPVSAGWNWIGYLPQQPLTVGEALANSTDCDDTNMDINPAVTEAAGDEIDQNCDGAETCFVDADGDGYRPGTGTATVNSTDSDCSDAGEALATDPTGDCNDGNAAVNPAAAENCGIAGTPGVDDDCDRSTDEDLTNPTAICRNVTLAIGASGNAALAAAQINKGSSDNCTAAGNLALSASPNLFDCADAGTAVAVLTVTDGAGRTATCVATVTVLDVLNYTETVRRSASDGLANDKFGWGVAVEGTLAVAGAPEKKVGTQNKQGAAYLFNGSNNWSQLKKLLAADGATIDYFGNSASFDGPMLALGAYGDNVGTVTDQGSAYVFAKDQGGTNNWGQIGKYAASDGLVGDQYGYALAASGTVLMVGANTDDVGTRVDQGSAYFLKGEDCPDASKPEDETTAAPGLSGQPSLFSCSPNPFRDELAVQLPSGGGPARVQILDATGGTVLSTELPAGQPQASLKTGWLPVGLYFVQVKTADGTATATVVKL